MKAVIEGLLFISGDEGLTFEEMKNILEIDNESLKTLLKELYKDYSNKDRGIKLELLGNHFKLTTKREHKDYYQKLIKKEESNKLSQSALETLSIIAYNEPISRIDIDEIRGVSSSYIIRKLLLKELIEEKGKSSAPGRPTLYGVTSNFLDYFGLGSTKELPEIKQNKEEVKEENHNLFETKYQETE